MAGSQSRVMSMEKKEKPNTDCIMWHRKLRDFFKQFAEEFRRDYGLKQIDLEILFYLHYNPSASIGEISRSQSLNKGQLSLAMTELKDKGYIDAKGNDQDKRYQIYHLTPVAEQIWDKIVAAKMRMKEQLYHGFSAEERATFEKMVLRMGLNIDRILEGKL